MMGVRLIKRDVSRDTDAISALADAEALAVYDTFERGAYRLLNAM
jgi:hypothetical protein